MSNTRIYDKQNLYVSSLRNILPLFIILVSALFIRLYGLYDYHADPNELIDIFIAKGDSLAEVWERGLHELHPPLGNYFRHLTFNITDSVLPQKLISIFYGILTVLVFNRIGNIISGKNCGLILALMTALIPQLVYISTLIRNYALFMLLLSLAFLYYISFLKNRSYNSLIACMFLITLAACTHFTGFFAAGSFGIHLIIITICQKDRKAIGILAVSCCAIAGIGIIFFMYYMLPGTHGYNWKEIAGSTLFMECSNYSGFVPFVFRVLSIFSIFNLYNAPLETFLSAGILIFCVYCISMYGLYKIRKDLLFSPCIIWITALMANFSGIYPFASPRQNIYLYPFILVPLAVYLSETTGFAWQKSSIGRIFTKICIPSIITISLLASISGFYMKNPMEYTLKLNTYKTANSILFRQYSPGDKILTSKFAYLYLMYDIDKGKTFYKDNETFISYQYLGMQFYTSMYRNYWQLTYKTLANILENINAGTNQPGSNTIWFYSAGLSDNIMTKLYRCPAFNGKRKGVYSDKGILIFGISNQDLQNVSNFSGCLKNYQDNLCAGSIYATD